MGHGRTNHHIIPQHRTIVVFRRDVLAILRPLIGTVAIIIPEPACQTTHFAAAIVNWRVTRIS